MSSFTVRESKIILTVSEIILNKQTYRHPASYEGNIFFVNFVQYFDQSKDYKMGRL